MSDIVHRLRDWRNLHLARGGELFEAAADEIERLRNGAAGYTVGISAGSESKPALTAEEREAIEFFAAIHNEGYGLFATHTDTLRNLLEKSK